MTEESLIRLNGTNNFRDFGGYKTRNGSFVKKGLLYRSDELSKLSKSAFQQFSDLNIRLIVDLRSPYDCARRPNRLPNRNDIIVENLPIFSDPEREKEMGQLYKKILFLIKGEMNMFTADYLKDMYQQLVTDYEVVFTRLLKLLIEPNNLPILIMCRGGKDRTGFAAALILLALGVHKETIFHDYGLTDRYLKKELEIFLNTMWFMSLFRTSPKMLRPFFQARPEYLQTAIDMIGLKYGSVDKYLQQGLGFSDEDKGKLNSILLSREYSNR